MINEPHRGQCPACPVAQNSVLIILDDLFVGIMVIQRNRFWSVNTYKTLLGL